jgi:hypothetical protein
MSVRKKINELISALKEIEGDGPESEDSTPEAEEETHEGEEPQEQVPPSPVVESGLLSEEESARIVQLRSELAHYAGLLGNLLLEYEAQKQRLVSSREKLVGLLQEEMQRVREAHGFPPEQALEIGVHPEYPTRVYIKKS